MVREADRPDSRGGVGITRYLKQTLMRGADFKRKSNVPRPAGKHSAGKGLAIGRHADHLLHRYYSKNKKLSTKQRDGRADKIIRHLENDLGLRHVATQYPVAASFDTHTIKTEIDFIGVKNDTLVVVELKCTQ